MENFRSPKYVERYENPKPQSKYLEIQLYKKRQDIGLSLITAMNQVHSIGIMLLLK